ncbi:hypothetical protein NUU61_008170 [Penicillium alfredii]|uniref:Ran-interacting protein Mog1 n=1 Tax=Penicillium alfredii TaxID=1506179 RepID=A0A9W9JZ06_9EURO|nr:uncharacterized protein NUU61_008170 [Penicillium alfredii]KAJ5086863.1 hypothetical protein NUU61_008170 [Penicillium alfredii]
MAQFTEQDFFGGAIRGVVPQGWIDASTLREIPDHQELFLSPRTLSNLIIEVNQRVPQEEALSTFTNPTHQQQTPSAGSGSAASATPETVDQAAALYHLHDLCDEGDTLQVITPPQRVSMARLSTQPASSTSSSSSSTSTSMPINAYKGVVSFTTPVRQRPGGGRVPAAVDGSTASVPDSIVASAALNGDSVGIPQTSKLTCHYLLVRLEPQETDLLVFLNVPHEEFNKSGDPNELSGEEAAAEETLAALREKLEIRDWGLFA